MYHLSHTPRYYFKRIKFARHVVSSAAFLLISRPISNFLSSLTDVHIDELDYLATSNIGSRLFNVMIPIALFLLWCTLVFMDIRSQFYKIETGRNLRYDSRHYKRSFSELLEFLPPLILQNFLLMILHPYIGKMQMD